MAAPAPHAGVALISALNILEGYNITSQLPRSSTFHWIAEVLQSLFQFCTAQAVGQSEWIHVTFNLLIVCFKAVKIALALASKLGDPTYDPSVSEVVDKMLR